jgi:16S rRNA (uracil1498-N3)-methyltransferase
MHRFFVSPQAIKDSRVILRGTIVHQIRDVLRMHPGDDIVLLDNSGWAHRAELVTVDRDAVRGRVVEKWKLETEPQTRITLYQGLLKGQKFDWVLQKGTEIGIAAFVPVLASAVSSAVWAT